jgi:hypothetical protein
MAIKDPGGQSFAVCLTVAEAVVAWAVGVCRGPGRR